MTPYDVIADLKEFVKDLERFPNDDTFRFEIDREGAKAILSVIRNAENDALERAAIECDKLASPDSDYAAEAVRALKHKASN